MGRISTSLVPGALLVILPKCPFCIAAGLTVATGLSISPAAAGWLRTAIVLLWIAFVVAMIHRRSASGDAPRSEPRR